LFVIGNQDFAKRLAKSISEILHELGMNVTRKQALHLAANLWGYRDYNHLVDDGIGSPSPYDDQCSPEDVSRRRAVQVAAAKAFGVKEGLINEFLELLKPTARREKKKDGSYSGPPPIFDSIRLSREAEAAGENRVAAQILVEAIQNADRRQKKDVVDELDRLCAVEPVACFNLGMAYLIGDTGSKDIERADSYFVKCCAFGLGDEAHALAMTARGDIEVMRAKGTSREEDPGLAFYRAAALTEKSPNAAYNCGLSYQRRGNHRLAAQFYLIAVQKKHVHAMTNLATMILNQQFDGGSKFMRMLYTEAARRGDGAAVNAMRMIDSLVRQVDFPEVQDAISNSAKWARKSPFIVDDLVACIPTRQWAKVLSDKDWRLSSVRLKLEHDMAAFAVASSASGKEVPVYLTCALHVVDHRDEEVLHDFTQLNGDGDAILLFNKLHVLNEPGKVDDRYLCIGLLRLAGVWSDVYLESGGLDAVLAQREALAANPALSRGRTFRCENAEEILSFLKNATLKNVERL
jgi:hypothetical protein